jgi:hypothetical protein
LAQAAKVEFAVVDLMRGLARREDLNQEWTAFRAEVTGVLEKAAKDIATQLVDKGPEEIQGMLTDVCRAGLLRLARGGRASKRTNERRTE